MRPILKHITETARQCSVAPSGSGAGAASRRCESAAADGGSGPSTASGAREAGVSSAGVSVPLSAGVAMVATEDLSTSFGFLSPLLLSPLLLSPLLLPPFFGGVTKRIRT
jgi:hypothetical protein